MIAALLAALAIGSTVSWTDGATGERSCGKLATVDDRGRAWILPDRSPHFYAIVPLATVSEGCPRP